MMVRTGVVAMVGAAALLVAPAASERPFAVSGSCSSLAALSLPDAKVTLAQSVDAGPFTPPGSAEPVRQLPAFCRVAATLRPTSDSDIKVEVWMPVSGWNGKFQAVGNGAFSGSIPYAAMSGALSRGYATASTDTGHTGNNAAFAAGHPEKVTDFGWRAVHDMTQAARQIIGAYYESGPKFSYWNGCSAGGRQAMKEAQRFPADYDGIVAGAPGLDWTGRAAQAVRIMKALDGNEPAQLSAAHTELLHRAVLNACDALDGVKDGLIANPAKCSFDPATLQCTAGGDAACLTAAQVDTARLIYSPMVNPNTHREVTGLARGSELGWTPTGWTASARATGLDQFRFLVFRDSSWSARRFQGDADIAAADAADGGTINALDADLKPFIDRGGKLIQYHGWSDPQISPFNSTQYYTRVVDAIGARVDVAASYRLFMAPGMGHCGGGEGPNAFDMVSALEQWVEHGRAPDRIVASHAVDGRVDRTRPLCPYPQVATYSGNGSIDDAANFACRIP